MDSASCQPDVPVDEGRFVHVVSTRCGPLLTLAVRLEHPDPAQPDVSHALFSRPFLAAMLSLGTQVEELLDLYGAATNGRWHRFRGLTAAIKAFARLHYNLLHLSSALPHYQLPEVEGRLEAQTLETAHFTARVLRVTARCLLAEAEQMGLTTRPIEVCQEDLPPGRLPRDRDRRIVGSAGETITKVATGFLNLGEAFARLGGTAEGESGAGGALGETELRDLEERSHNLQALYDTHVSNTDVEAADPELRSLRGHASVVYHLLEIATGLAHYQERHVGFHCAADAESALFPIPGSPTVGDLIAARQHYALAHAFRYAQSGRRVAQALLRRYAELGEVTVPVPRYRGFHVRPSTLVARIVNHYGSPVSMELDHDTYDVSTPLELFRANEKINAHKRRWIAAEVERLVGPAHHHLGEDLQRFARRIVMLLAEQARIIVYEQPIPSIDPPPPDHPPELSWLIDEITRMQSLGKIDIETPLLATFRGDRRVLSDIELLARSGYGEDPYGNNVPLPRELAYLRGPG